MIQQGDVVLIRVDCLPDGVKNKEGYTLAEGEVTGHSHRITELDTNLCDLFEKDGVLYVKAKESVSLIHQEHKAVEIPTGVWKVNIVKEFDHFLEESRNVQD